VKQREPSDDDGDDDKVYNVRLFVQFNLNLEFFRLLYCEVFVATVGFIIM